MTAVQSSNSSSLVGRSIRALKWSYFGVAARIVLQFVAQIALARLVGPDGFGVVAAALFVVQITAIVAELGLGDAIVQSQQITAEQLRVAYTRIVFCTAACSGVLILGADTLAIWFGNHHVATVLRWMTLVIVVQSLGIVPLAMLRRNLDFKAIQVAQVFGYLMGFVLIGITTAYLDAGVWSLVAAWISQSAISTLIQFAKAPHSLVPMMRHVSVPFTGFGWRTTVGNLVNVSAEHIDKMIVGRAYGTGLLGTYSVAYNLVRTPVNHVVLSLQQVVYSFTSRAQDDPETMRKTYLMMLWIIPMLTFPTFMSVSAIAPTVVEALYGTEWRDAAAVLAPLALAMPLHSLQAVGGPILRGSNRVGREILISLGCTVLIVLVLIATATISFVAMAWGVMGVYLVRSIWTTSQVSQLLELSLGEALRVTVSGLILGALTSAMLYIGDNFLTVMGVAPVVRLVAAIVIGAVWLLLVVWGALPWLTPRSLRGVLPHIIQRLPRRIGYHMSMRLRHGGFPV